MDPVFRSHASTTPLYGSFAPRLPVCGGRPEQALSEELAACLPREAAERLGAGDLRHYAQVAETVFREMAFTLELPWERDDDDAEEEIRRAFREAAADYRARRPDTPGPQAGQPPPRRGLPRNDAALDLHQLCRSSMRKGRTGAGPDHAESQLFLKDLYLAYFYSVLYQELAATGIDWNDKTAQQQVAMLSALSRQALHQRDAMSRQGDPVYDITGMHDFAALQSAYAPFARALGIEPAQCPEFGLRFTVEKNILDDMEREWGFPADNPLLLFMFEVEKNYAGSMANAWHAACGLVGWLRTGGALCAQQLEKLHAICLQDVLHNSGRPKPAGMGNGKVRYSLSTGHGLTPDGAREWSSTCAKLNRLCDEAIVELGLPPAKGPLVSLRFVGESWQSGLVRADMKRHEIYPAQHSAAQKAVVRRVADKLIDEFYVAMRAADAMPRDQPETRAARCRAIAGLCQSLERLHPFSDGNGRLFEFLLPNVLLLTYGFGAYAPVRPYRIDGATCDDVLEEFLEGQKAVLALRAKGPGKK